MNINFSIPVTLFDYRESDNPLYSYAKLKIFYIGMTPDKRLFTEKFSDKLLQSLPYVPVVGYFDKEEDDFKGHNLSVQYIYGIVPDDTLIDFIEEDNKKYAVCDVILYTGRGDETGEIAKKIVGKSHSLELNPADTKYKVNTDPEGKVMNYEFTEGTLLGLSVLGDNEKPAFTGSEFFTEDSNFMKVFEGFKEQLEIFTKENKQRGEEMAVENTENPVVTEEAKPEVFTEEPVVTEEPVITEEPKPSTTATEDDQPIVEEPVVEQPPVTEVVDHSERLTQAFMKTTNAEEQEEISKAVRNEIGEYCYIVQWSPSENVLVYLDYANDVSYFRVSYTKDESGAITFGDKVEVKPRFLTEEEINSTFVEQEQVLGTEETETSKQEDGTFNEQEEQEANSETTTEEISTVALDSSERQELEDYRRRDKEELIESFKEDLTNEFIESITEAMDELSLDEIDTKLSKEFTKMMKMHREGNKNQNTLAYKRDFDTKPETEEEMVKRLVAQYK